MVAETYSNPVAPAGFAKVDSTKSEQLKNEDFRKLLQTPRPGGAAAGPALGGGYRGAQTMSAKDTGQQAKKHNPDALYYKERAREKAEFESKYKDRAKERRLKEDKEEEDIPLPVFAPTADIVDSQAAYLARIEQTKYLGGDLEHTHLVKGLDYALLQKVKADLDMASKEGKDGGAEKGTPAKPEEPFRTALGRRIFEAAFEQKPMTRNELFVPGRMAYAFMVVDDPDTPSDIPVTLLRSKAEVAGLKHELAQAVTNDLVITKLTQIFTAIRKGAREKKEKKKRARELRKLGLPAANGAASPTKGHQADNIYGDIGDYVPPSSIQGEGSVAARGTAGRPASYFANGTGDSGDADMEIDEGSSQMPADQSQGTGAGDDVTGPYPAAAPGPSGPAPSVHESRQATINQRLQKLTAEGSGYGDTFDSAYDYGDVVYDDDSDVEPDYSKMDQGKKVGPSRFDYDDEEEWAKEKERQEAMPKAAFQYGVKMGAGRTTRRNRGGAKEVNKEAREKQKIDLQLNKMQQIWKRKSDGVQHSSGKRARDALD